MSQELRVIIEQVELDALIAEPETIIVALVDGGIKGDPGATGAADLATGIAATNLSGHQVVRWNSSGQLALASADVLAHRVAVAGVTTGAVVSGDEATVQSANVIEHSGWSWTADQLVFLGLNGALTQSVPISAQYRLVIGMAVSPTRLAISIQPPVVIS